MIHVTFLSDDPSKQELAELNWVAKKLGGHFMSAGSWIAVSDKPFDADQAHYAAEEHIEHVYTNALEDQATMQDDLHQALPFKVYED